MIEEEPIAEGEATPIPAPGADAQTSRQRAIVINVLRYTLLVLVVAAAVWQLWINWEAVKRTITELQWQRVLLSFVALLGGMAFATLSWQVLVDDLGKPIGIVLATLLGARLLRLHPDARGAWSDLLAVSCTAGIGFTVSLLINSLTFDGRAEEIGKSGVLIASVLSAVLAAVLLTWRSRVHERRGDAVPPS